MIIGFLLALVFFGSLSYFLTRAVISSAYRSGRPMMGALFAFLALLGGLCLLSFALMAAGSMLGFSLALGLEALVSGLTHAQPGVVTAIAALVIGILNIFSVLVGPAGAFITAKIVGITALITGALKVEEKQAVTWLPVLAAVTATWCMWPFTACLSLGL